MTQKYQTLNINILLQLVIINLDIVANKIKSEGLVDKSAIEGFINNVGLDKKKSSNISNKS